MNCMTRKALACLAPALWAACAVTAQAAQIEEVRVQARDGGFDVTCRVTWLAREAGHVYWALSVVQSDDGTRDSRVASFESIEIPARPSDRYSLELMDHVPGSAAGRALEFIKYGLYERKIGKAECALKGAGCDACRRLGFHLAYAVHETPLIGLRDANSWKLSAASGDPPAAPSPCRTCGGSGHVDQSVEAECSSCGGEARVECRRCGGQGYHVDAIGQRLGCHYCRDGMALCNLCNGRGHRQMAETVPCRDCGGSAPAQREGATVSGGDCHDCQGKGFVLKFADPTGRDTTLVKVPCEKCGAHGRAGTAAQEDSSGTGRWTSDAFSDDVDFIDAVARSWYPNYGEASEPARFSMRMNIATQLTGLGGKGQCELRRSADGRTFVLRLSNEGRKHKRQFEVQEKWVYEAEICVE